MLIDEKILLPPGNIEKIDQNPDQDERGNRASFQPSTRQSPIRGNSPLPCSSLMVVKMKVSVSRPGSVVESKKGGRRSPSCCDERVLDPREYHLGSKDRIRASRIKRSAPEGKPIPVHLRLFPPDFLPSFSSNLCSETTGPGLQEYNRSEGIPKSVCSCSNGSCDVRWVGLNVS